MVGIGHVTVAAGLRLVRGGERAHFLSLSHGNRLGLRFAGPNVFPLRKPLAGPAVVEDGLDCRMRLLTWPAS